ncbi:protein of unknown function (DUF303) [Labedella gwakjiensis]|uniref:Sialate O-acetylesterase domain-containing protein n=1 Tax=Labedella gwakjiensis TaxID=390269 RepID=A0A2P8GR51_9MICO|nr:protein of unknown function (DUF303) [Labedella gwakjiensis]RUQ85637.1 hypothetical protein ELQ93_00920 [Labedella gwakjiensis]
MGMHEGAVRGAATTKTTTKRKRTRRLVSIAALVGVIATSGVVAVSGNDEAAAAVPNRCADVAELSSGFETLYRVELPRAATWNTNKPVPYAERVVDDRRTFERVAYCLETVTATGVAKRAYASFDAFSSTTADYEIPTRARVLARPVSNLTVQGDGVASVTNAAGGAIEFWPYTYSGASPNGSGTNAYDYSDTPTTAAGYGSFQIHNTAAKQTVMAVNAWNRTDRPLDIGIGNQPTGNPDWTFSQTGGSLRSATLTAYVKYAELAAVDCESGVGELADYQLLYEAEVPTTAEPWLDGVDYVVDRRAELTTPISRVAYCLEGRNARTPQWTYASMDTWTQNLAALRVPETEAARTRPTVDNLTVRSSTINGVPATTPADGATGSLEMWPNQYNKTAAANAPAGASSALWDFSDTPALGNPSGYGSFQVHNLTSRQTVLAVNGWSYPAATPLDVGVGNRATGDPDWTFARNRAQFSDLTLKVYVRPAGVTVSSGPIDHQLYPRNSDTGTVTVPVKGSITDSSVTGVGLVTKRNGVTVSTKTTSATSFTLSTVITAELASYDVELWAVRASGAPTLIRSASDVVAGDVYVVEGQSNSVSSLWSYAPGFSSAADTSPWIRTFGGPTSTPAVSVTDRTWYRAIGDARDPRLPGLVGRLGLRLGAAMIAQSGVPVAVIMGGEGGKPSSFFQRNDGNPLDAGTNYGRLLRRIQAAGLGRGVTSMVWYQGESDVAAPAAHRSNMQALLADWKTDFPGLTQTYMAQVRSCSAGNDISAVQEIQRQLDARSDVTIVSTNGLENHDGCHYGYDRGYRRLADWFALPMGRDLLGSRPAGPVSPPKPAAFSWANANRTGVVITVQDASQALTCDAAAAADFRIEGATASVTRVTCGAGTVTLTLSRSVPTTATISYLGHRGAVTSASAGIPDTAWITNAAGMGLIAFARQPVR